MGRWCLPQFFTLTLVVAICVNVAQAQDGNATTDPYEARVLNSIFSKWGILANQDQWNISGELCSGSAIDSTTTIDDSAYNPFIKCDCSYDNKTTCHITALKVYAVDVVGEIPEELWTLTYLTNLNLAQNYLTGSLPPAIGNLTRMQYMTFGINALSGELPKELGYLTDLRSLSYGSNNFSGSFPSELGDLVKLEQLYAASSGISGPIPPTFAKLKNLLIVWASDMELTDNIPDFIGSWSKLQTLRFQGNSFEGRIPSSFSNLTSLTELRISGLSNGSSSLEFLRNMKSLTILELRNNNISGSIPSTIGELQNLTQLDLSFNNFSGLIPGSIFNLSLLSFLFLGNNKLNGTVPTQKSSSLLNIDLSYNDLTGSFPSWVNEQNLQLEVLEVRNPFHIICFFQWKKSKFQNMAKMKNNTIREFWDNEESFIVQLKESKDYINVPEWYVNTHPEILQEYQIELMDPVGNIFKAQMGFHKGNPRYAGCFYEIRRSIKLKKNIYICFSRRGTRMYDIRICDENENEVQYNYKRKNEEEIISSIDSSETI